MSTSIPRIFQRMSNLPLNKNALNPSINLMSQRLTNNHNHHTHDAPCHSLENDPSPSVLSIASLADDSNDDHQLLIDLRTTLAQNGNTTYAAKMKKYLKTTEPLYGIKAPLRRQLLKTALSHHPLTSFHAYQSTILSLWNKALAREERYLAIDIATLHKSYRAMNVDADVWPLFSHMIKTSDGWDTLDPITIHLVGDLVKIYPQVLEPHLMIWRSSSSSSLPSNGLWVRRASLLAHMNHGRDTNRQLLEETIMTLAGEKDFFIQKAIGWVLRNYTRTDPTWVQKFVTDRGDELATLSRREALKHVGVGLVDDDKMKQSLDRDAGSKRKHSKRKITC